MFAKKHAILLGWAIAGLFFLSACGSVEEVQKDSVSQQQEGQGKDDSIGLPPDCPPVMCALYCEYGFKLGEDGCPVCDCADESDFCGGFAGITCPEGQRCELDGDYPDAGGTCQPCPPVLCKMFCADGFQVGEDGCEVCACEEKERNIAEGSCIRNSEDSCTTDEDCMIGGCGGELCYNPALSGGYSTCECFIPVGLGCGCVNGKCNWWN